MQPKDWKLAGSLCAGVAVALIAAAAEPVKLNVKPGLWEIASESKMNGTPEIPAEQLARLTPEQRNRIQAAMQASLADAVKPHLAKHCLTPEKIAQGMDLDPQDNGQCDKKIATNSGSELQLSEKCAEDGGGMFLEEHIQLSNSETVNGTVHMVRTTGSKSMTIDSNLHGKWLGASCGDIKDFQIEK